MNLQELLNDLSADRDKYNIPVIDSARYAIRSIVETGDASYLPALPEEVHQTIIDMVATFKRHGHLTFLSNLGEEDMTETMEKFVRLCQL